MDALRSDLDVVGMRLSKKGDIPVREFTIYNESSSPMSLDWAAEDKSVEVEIPSVLKPGEAAKVKVSVNTRRMPSGNYEKKIHLLIDGRWKSEAILLKGSVE